MIGRINAWKGQKFLLQALLRSQRRIQLRIVGSAIDAQVHLVEELHHIARSLPEGVSCEFFGFCEDPSEHYRWCHYVVVPSTSPEPFGRVAIEGFSYGKPVIAAAHGGLTEIVEHGQDGFLFEPASQVALAQTIEGLPVPFHLATWHWAGVPSTCSPRASRCRTTQSRFHDWCLLHLDLRHD